MSLRTSATGEHQRLGPACDECRRRKLRCDGQQPQCGVCRDTDNVCEITHRGTRGPKKGHLKALKGRVEQLEAILEDRQPLNTTEPCKPTAAPSVPEIQPQPFGFLSNPASDSDGLSSLFPLPLTSNYIPLTGVLRTELDQLYLDRVHQSIPILHQRRYLSWSKSTTKTASRTCLQYAMWTLASLLSTQFRDMVDPLCQKTKQMLERLSLEANNDSNVTTEFAQAWVLVVIFESMRTYHRQAWMSVGRAFRLVQAMRYHEIDSPLERKEPPPSLTGDLIEVEERRRVFWMAYFLDHMISIRDDWPITLNEHVICTRLPAPDTEFQNGHHQLGPFLSEAITDPDLKVRSSFNECIILATICGRSLLQSQQYHISKVYGGMALDWTGQHLWLENLLTTRLPVLSHSADAYSPLMLFASILGQATVIYFCKTMMNSTITFDDEIQATGELFNHQNRALEASTNIICLASRLRDLPCAKIHPLMPMPLFLCAEFLYANMHTGEPFQSRLRELFLILRELKNVNNYQESYLELLPRSCISKTSELFRESAEGTAAQ